MKLRDAGKPGDTAPRVPRDRVRLMWTFDFYDGPVSGLAELDGEMLWFCLAEEAEEAELTEWYRRFWLVRLSSDELTRLQRCARDFEAHVGTHWSGEGDGAAGHRRPESEHRKFYDKWPTGERGPAGLADCEVLAWFEAP